MVATCSFDFISAIATCIATVDLPDPPFSLPTTITRPEGDGIAFVMDMIALHASGMIDLSYFAVVNKVLPVPGTRPRREWIGEPVRDRVRLVDRPRRRGA